jgi:hypothetical protein
MAAQGIVIQPAQDPVSSFPRGRLIVLKLLGGATGDSIMMFEETIPAGTKSTFHRIDDRGRAGRDAAAPRLGAPRPVAVVNPHFFRRRGR